MWCRWRSGQAVKVLAREMRRHPSTVRDLLERCGGVAAGGAAAVGVAVVVGGAGGDLSRAGRGSVVRGDRGRVGLCAIDGQPGGREEWRPGWLSSSGSQTRRGLEPVGRSRPSSPDCRGWRRWWKRNWNGSGRRRRLPAGVGWSRLVRALQSGSVLDERLDSWLCGHELGMHRAPQASLSDCGELHVKRMVNEVSTHHLDRSSRSAGGLTNSLPSWMDGERHTTMAA